MAENAVIIANGWLSADWRKCTIVADLSFGKVNFYRRLEKPALTISLVAWTEIAKSVDLAIYNPKSPTRRLEVRNAFPANSGLLSRTCAIYALPDQQALVFEADAEPVLQISFVDVAAINALWPNFPYKTISQNGNSVALPGSESKQSVIATKASAPMPIVLHVVFLLTLAIEAGFIDPDNSGEGTLLAEVSEWIEANCNGMMIETRPLLAEIAPAMVDPDYVWHGSVRVSVASHGLRVYIADPPAALTSGEFEASIFIQRQKEENKTYA